jgi:peptide/nickel transport system substrate-binding protein
LRISAITGDHKGEVMSSPGNEPIDLVNALNQGRISRRDFVRRGALLGLSLPAISAALAACGGDDEPEASTPDTASGDTASAPSSATASATPGGTIRVATQKPAATLDPIAMQDLGAYGLIAQSFEFLAALGDAGDIGPGLAESWTPNDDATVWTFALRQGVKWHDGTDFTSADVAASLDRLATAGNSGLKGVIDVGSVDASDPAVAVVTLLSPNGNFPYLVSVFNAQAVITPVAYAVGTTLDASPNGTGPWKLTKYDAATGAEYARNDEYWGGAPNLETVTWSFFDDDGAMVTALSGGDVDALVQFQALGGAALLDNPDFTVEILQATTHREIWMRCDTGQFADKRVRQALGMCLDRPALIETLFGGKADLGNDHVIAPFYKYFDATVPQRTRDTAGAKQLLADAGFPDGLTADLHFGELQEIPELAQLIQQQAIEGGFTLNLAGESLDTFYGSQWCPGEPADPPCSGASELGIVDYGHRATPDVFLNAALKTGGDWNSSQYASPEFDAAFAAFQASIGLEAQTAASKTIEEILLEDSPILVPYFYNYISGWSKKFDGIKISALGQMFLAQATQVA